VLLYDGRELAAAKVCSESRNLKIATSDLPDAVLIEDLNQFVRF
jgi:hypothetical protein